MIFVARRSSSDSNRAHVDGSLRNFAASWTKGKTISGGVVVSRHFLHARGHRPAGREYSGAGFIGSPQSSPRPPGGIREIRSEPPPAPAPHPAISTRIAHG